MIVFVWPKDRTKDFIKRVVATEGQTVEMRQKQVYIDVDAVDLGVVRATTFIVASGCLSGCGTSVDGKGKTSSSIRKKPGKLWSRNCVAVVGAAVVLREHAWPGGRG